MITPDGAALIATLYPIVVLLLIFDSRRIKRPQYRTLRTMNRTYIVVGGIGSVLAVPAVQICVRRVNEQANIDGFDLAVVALSGTLLGAGVLASVAYWAADRIIDPWAEEEET